MIKYTPGPWTAKQLVGTTERGWVIIWQDGQRGRRLDDGGEFSEGNARLIAAAPELLSALEGLVWRDAAFENGKFLPADQQTPLMRTAMEVIAKATGKEVQP